MDKVNVLLVTGLVTIEHHSSIWVDPHWPDEWRKLLGGYCAMDQGCMLCALYLMMSRTIRCWDSRRSITRSTSRTAT